MFGGFVFYFYFFYCCYFCGFCLFVLFLRGRSCCILLAMAAGCMGGKGLATLIQALQEEVF